MERFASRRSFAEFLTDQLVGAAVERKLEICGEALKRIRDDEGENGVLDEIAEWRKAIGLRNILAHGYDVIRPDILWNVAMIEGPQMLKAILALLGLEKADVG